MSSLFVNSLFDNPYPINVNDEMILEDDQELFIDFDYFNEYYFNN